MSLPHELIREMEKLGLEVKNLKHKEGRIYETLEQPELFSTNWDSEDGIL